jgi:CheY-like chemotaxis protein/chemotaxis signal transduction protein
MSLPHLLLVDDSRAVLTYEQAALSALYGLSTASNGVEALQKARALRPDGILLDLSMPEMDGDAVLAALKADENLSQVPVIIISSEHGRAEACMKAGAAAYLPKPIRAPELRALVARTLDDARQKGRRGSLAILSMCVGAIEIGIALESVHEVLPQLPTHPLPFGPVYLRETFDLGDEPVCILDLAKALGVEHRLPLEDRRLVVVRHEQLLIALSVDVVRDPEEFLSRDVIPRERLGGTEHRPLSRILRAVVRSARGSLAVVDPLAILSPDLIAEIASALSSVGDAFAAGRALASEGA